jgi:hypothetical protein
MASDGKAKKAVLPPPFEGQCADPPEARGRQFSRLMAGEDGFDDVGRQEGKL